MNKKKKIIIISAIILIIILLSLVGIYYVKRRDPKITLKKDLTVSIFEEKTNLSFIDKIENGTILTKEENIDTSTLGTKEISLIIENKFGKEDTFKYTITILDKESPVITYNKQIEVIEGESSDLLEGVTATDNSKEEIKVTIEGEYDLNTKGEYKIYYVAKDSSNNETKEEATLIVKEKPKSNTNSDGTRIMSDRTFTTSKGYKGEIKNGVAYINGILIANKTYYLPSNYGDSLTSKTKNAFEIMKNAASNDGLNIYISSGFRSYDTQDAIYNRYVRNDGKEKADTYSARPGHSEHQTGLAFDVNIIDDSFAGTPEAIWLEQNCYKYGFILRYPKGKTNETGYIYEPWHFRYIGDENLAKALYNNGDWLTLEDYFGITSEYDY